MLLDGLRGCWKRSRVDKLSPLLRDAQVQWYERLVSLQPQLKGLAEKERELVEVTVFQHRRESRRFFPAAGLGCGRERAAGCS